MSLQKCSGTTGFPIRLSQNIFNPWAGGYNPSDPKVTNQLVVPTDFSISWGPKTQVEVSVDNSQNQFKINGLESANTATTLIYGSANYYCQRTLSIIKIQHANLTQAKDATQELIMAFRIKNAQEKKNNPSSPDIILLCRPVVLISNTNSGSEFWRAVNNSVLKNNRVLTSYNAAENFTYDGSVANPILLPMMTYETCIPTQLLSSTNPPKEGSTRIRVHVVTRPLNIASDDDGTGTCRRVLGFIMPINNLADIFGENKYTNAQFTNGTSADGTTKTYPAATTPLSDSLTVNLASPIEIGSWQSSSGIGTVLQTFAYLVPETFMGKSLSEIAAMSTNPKGPSIKKAFKCYTIDPRKDVVGDQILIDPTTGQTLTDTMRQEVLDSSGGDPALAAALAGNAIPNDGILPGDIENTFLVIFSIIAGIALIAYAFYILRFFGVGNYKEGSYHTLGFFVMFFIIFGISYGSSVSSKRTKV